MTKKIKLPTEQCEHCLKRDFDLIECPIIKNHLERYFITGQRCSMHTEEMDRPTSDFTVEDDGKSVIVFVTIDGQKHKWISYTRSIPRIGILQHVSKLIDSLGNENGYIVLIRHLEKRIANNG